MDDEKKLVVSTPMGDLIAYPSCDPDNPGIHIELKKPGIDFTLNLTTVECQISGDDEFPDRMITHVWGHALNEDTTHDITHESIGPYFDGAEMQS